MKAVKNIDQPIRTKRLQRCSARFLFSLGVGDMAVMVEVTAIRFVTGK